LRARGAGVKQCKQGAGATAKDMEEGGMGAADVDALHRCRSAA